MSDSSATEIRDDLAPTADHQAQVFVERRRIERRTIRRGDGTLPVLVLPEPHIGGRPVASVLVVDDHTLLGDTIVGTLRREGFLAHAVAPTSAADVIGRATVLQPTVALVDLDLGSAEFDGLDLIEPLLDLGVDVVTLLAAQEPLLAAASLEGRRQGGHLQVGAVRHDARRRQVRSPGPAHG